MKRGSNSAVGGASKRHCRDLLSIGEVNTHLQLDRVKFCDVKLRLGIQIFPAHRVVLAAKSRFLAALFDGQFKDSLAPIVDIHEMEPHALTLALDYMYHGTCEVPGVTVLQQVLSVASVLQIDALFADVVAALENNITVDNCASMLACADHHHLPQLQKAAEAVAEEAFVAVASDPALPATSMLALLERDLNVNSEMEVFETLSMWLKGQTEPLGEEERLKMFSLVRFALLSQDFIDSTVMAEPAFSTPHACKLWLTQFKDAFSGGSKPQLRGTAHSKFLSVNQHRQIISWLDKGAATKLELLYRASSDGWEAVDFHSMCDNKGPTVTVIKCTGGYIFGGFTSTPWASSGKWMKCADAFIFSLHRPGGVGPVKLAISSKHAIFDHSAASSTFGSSDIHLAERGYRTQDSSTNIACYELPPGHPPVDATAFFTGSEMFQAAEVEVFRVAT